MAHLKPSNFNISKGFCIDEDWRYGGTTSGIYLIHVQRIKIMKGVGLKLRRRRRRRGGHGNGNVTHCCTCSSNSTSSSSVSVDVKYGDSQGQFGNLVSEYGWKVRRMVEKEEEMRKVAQVQAEAFYEPLFFLNHLFFDFFKAEVLQGLIYRLRNSPTDRYACLVAEPSTDAPPDSTTTTTTTIVGVVDVTFLRDEQVVQHLKGEKEYLYVSGIAVLNNFRRQKVATALLKACDVLSVLWCSTYLVLRAYEDDWGARKLYSNAGYRVVSRDPPWTSTWIGRKSRVLMIKRCNNFYA